MIRLSQQAPDFWRCQRGYTMIETLTFTVLVVIVTGASIPVLGDVYSSFKLRTSAEALVGELQLAKMKAVNDNASVTITFNNSARTYQVQGQPLRYLETSVSYSGTLPASLTFTSRGRLSSGGTQSITLLGRNNKTHVVSINTSGRISLN